MKSRQLFLVISILILLCSIVYAQDVPQLIFYQGNLADENGNRVNGNQNMHFCIWSGLTDGEKLWEENHTTVSINNGLFSVMLGSENPIPVTLFSTSPRYLEITIGGETLSPRQQIGSVPFAQTAASVSGTSNVFPSEGNVGIGTKNPQSEISIGDDGVQGVSVYAKSKNENIGIVAGINSSVYGKHAETGHIGILGHKNYGVYGKSDTSFAGYFNGRVHMKDSLGLGVKYPKERLEVAGKVHSTEGGFKFPDGSVQTTAATGGTGTADNLGNHTATQNVNTNGHWVTGDGENEGVYVKEDGNVGIGTSAPTEKLVVNGTIESIIGGIKFPDGSVQATAATGGTGTADNLGNHTATQNIKMDGNWVSGDGSNGGVYVANNGNVGIGKNNPGTSLDVDQNVSISGNGTEGGQLSLLDGDGQGGWEIDNSGGTGEEDLRVFRDKGQNDVYNAMVIKNSGNVGIGTSSPESRMHIKNGSSGGSPVANSNLVVEDNDHTTINVLTPSDKSAGITFGDSETSNAGEIKYSHSDDAMRFKTGGSYKMIIESDGDVGIGTTSPDARLSVSAPNGSYTNIGGSDYGIRTNGGLIVSGPFKGNNGPNGGAPFPRPAFDSGWVLLDEIIKTISHQIGGDVDNYFVDFQFKDLDDNGNLGERGIHIENYGSDSFSGAYWYDLTSSAIKVRKVNDDQEVDQARVRIWVIQ